MSETNHGWCRDVRRDEAIRAAEDAAAVPSIQHRDLPEVVAALAERVAELTTKHNALADLARLDAGWLKANEQRLTAERDAARARVAELEAAAPPRGWLTAEERALIESLRATFEQNADALRTHGLGGHVDNWERRVRLLDAILARETPPKVKVPHLDDLEADERPVWESACSEWIAAIRAAGGEVEG